MSASARGASKANKDKTTKTQTTQSKADGTPNKLQASSEQLRIAQLALVGSKDEEQKIGQVMELTGRTQEDAALALHDCGNDLQKAINMLLEGNSNEGEWEESAASKKKKRQQQNAALKPPEEAETNHKPHRSERSDRPPRLESNRDRSESGQRPPRNAPPRMANRGMSRGRDMNRGDRPDREWRGKESEENERNREDSARRGRGRGRGRGGGRRGGGFGRPNRFNQDNGPQIDTWSNDVADQDGGKTEGEDWSVEEWTGSLAESQVFTASTQQAPTIDTFSATDANDTAPLGSSVTTATTLPSNTQAFQQTRLDVGSLFDKSDTDQFTAQYNKQATESLKTAMGLTKLESDLGSLGSSQFSKEATESLKSIMGIGTTVQSVQNSSQSLPQRTVSPAVTKPHKTKLPPPSKIPTAPVEMPGSTYNSGGTGFDLQFGNLDLGKDNEAQAAATFTFGNDTSAFTASSYSTAGDASTMSNHLGQVGMDGGQSAASIMSSAQSGLDSQSNSMFHQTLDANKYQQPSSKMTSPPEPIPFPSSTQTDRKSSPLLSNQRPSSGPGSLGTSKSTSSPTSYGSSNYSAYPSSYQSTKLPPATTTASSTSTFNSYSQGQYGSSPAAYPGSFSQSAYSGQSAAPVQQNSVYQSSSQHGAFSSPPSAPAGFRDNQYPTEASSNSYPPSGYGQQSSASPYPASTTSGFQAYGSTTRASALPSSNINPSLSKYGDGSTSTANLTSATTTTTSSPMAAGTSTVSSISLTPSSASLSTGRTTGSTSTNKTSPNLPPGVSAAMLGQSQFMIPQSTIPGMPFYPGLQGVQQPIYFDDPQQQQQLQRLLLPYYDMSTFQMSASLPSTATDQARMTGLNYTGSGNDAKLTRVDAQSPVNATQSSQQQQPQSTHQQPYINAAMPPYYYYGLPGQIPYMFPQGVTNTASGHGSSTVNQPYQKQQAYGSHTGYGTGYDDLSQNQAADFTKTYGVSQPQSKGSTAVMTTVSTGGVADISSVYSKNHAPSAFDKAGYGGTPPPFNLANLPGPSQSSALAAHNTPYGTHMFVSTLPQQQMMHHQMQPDASSVAARSSQQGAGQLKTSLNKSYGTSQYWSGN